MAEARLTDTPEDERQACVPGGEMYWTELDEPEKYMESGRVRTDEKTGCPLMRAARLYAGQVRAARCESSKIRARPSQQLLHRR